MENYEKKYKEALVKARQEYNTTENVERKQWLEKIFPELVDSEDEHRQRMQKIAEEKVKELLEKQGKKRDINQTLIEKEKMDNAFTTMMFKGKTAMKTIYKKNVDNTNKVEPKFKVGDWVVYNRTDSSMEILYIYDIRDGKYYFNDNIHFSWSVKECDEKCHLWTIADAKDGDVFVANIHHWEIGRSIENFPVKVSTIFIYQKVKTDNKNIHAYVSLFDNTTLDIYRNMYYMDEYGIKDIHPATKEQSDLLFQKIKETGYEWNSKKKELRKIL